MGFVRGKASMYRTHTHFVQIEFTEPRPELIDTHNWNLLVFFLFKVKNLLHLLVFGTMWDNCFRDHMRR